MTEGQGISAEQLALLGTLMTTWAFILGAIIEGLKMAASWKGQTPTWLVRILPVSAIIIGGLTGPWVFPLALHIIALEVGEAYTWSVAYVGLFCGFGAGAVSGQAYKMYKQTFLRQDSRLADRESDT